MAVAAGERHEQRREHHADAGTFPDPGERPPRTVEDRYEPAQILAQHDQRLAVTRVSPCSAAMSAIPSESSTARIR